MRSKVIQECLLHDEFRRRARVRFRLRASKITQSDETWHGLYFLSVIVRIEQKNGTRCLFLHQTNDILVLQRMWEAHTLRREFHRCALKSECHVFQISAECSYPNKCIFELIDHCSVDHSALWWRERYRKHQSQFRSTYHIFHGCARSNDQSRFEIGFLSTLLRVDAD